MEEKKPKLQQPPENLIDAAVIAMPFRKEIAERVKKLKDSGFQPVLVGFLANSDVSAKKYAEWTARSCQADGIEFQLRECQPNELESELKKANEDPKVTGIMVYYPCFGAQPSFFGGSMDDYIRDSIAVEKDVEGLCLTYRRNLYKNVRTLQYLDGSPSPYQCLLPCTPLAIVKILEYLHVYDMTLPHMNRLNGKTICVVNRSEIVGRPVAAMLANDGAEVYSVDIDSVFLMRRGEMIKPKDEKFNNVEHCVRCSDVVIVGVPSSSYSLPVDWLKEHAVVVNVSNFKNINEAELFEKKPNAKYVPLVGKCTVAMLERNLLRLTDNYHFNIENKPIVKVIEAGGRVVKL